MSLFLFGGIALVAAVFYFRMKSASQPTVSPQEAADAAVNGTAVIIDVREAPEWNGGVAAPAFLLALSDLKGARSAWGPVLEKNRDKRLLLYCQAGMRAGMAAALLASEGFKAENMGGYPQWVKSGLPVRTP